jgi:DNA-binding MarR family transcriptional regulator
MSRTTASKLLLQLRRLSANAVMYSGVTAAAAKLHTTDMECLELLTLHGPLTAGRLSELTGLTTGSTTTMIDRLEAADYVVRRQQASDRRRVIIVPNTRKIDADLDHISASLGKAMFAFISQYSNEELCILHAFMQEANTIVEAEIAQLAKRNVSSNSE